MASIPDHTLPFNALGDYSFNLAIYELQRGPVRYDPERLSSLNNDPNDHRWFQFYPQTSPK